MMTLTDQERQLLNSYQRGLPVDARPYAVMAESCGMTEQQVIERLQSWQDSGVVSRIGAVVNHQKVGSSTLAALAVPEQDIDRVAEQVSAFAEVNHNYQREHVYNLWFVLAAPTKARVDAVLEQIKTETGLPLLNLPMLKSHHLDLGFAL
ncbi:MAG: Lrp/AsnC family transcriptional regulator [Motiliproteus sp.]